MWILLLLMFWEPAHSQDFKAPHFLPTLVIEALILLAFVVDDLLDLVHRCLDSAEVSPPYLRLLLFICNLVFDSTLLLDLCCSHLSSLEECATSAGEG